MTERIIPKIFVKFEKKYRIIYYSLYLYFFSVINVIKSCNNALMLLCILFLICRVSLGPQVFLDLQELRERK